MSTMIAGNPYGDRRHGVDDPVRADRLGVVVTVLEARLHRRRHTS
jgi:hypothetical protein